jgi:hypothetical protein
MRLRLALGLTGSLLACLAAGCAPPTNQAKSGPVSAPSPPAPPPPTTGASGAGNNSLPPLAPNGAAPNEAPPEQSPFSALTALSPLAAYEDLEKRIDAVLRRVTDGPSANAAAAELAPLTAELKLKLRPYLASLAAMSDAERNSYVQRKTEEAISQKSSGNEVNHAALIDLARDPGNEQFKAALVAMFQTMNAEGSTGIRRMATRMLEKLNQP